MAKAIQNERTPRAIMRFTTLLALWGVGFLGNCATFSRGLYFDRSFECKTTYFFNKEDKFANYKKVWNQVRAAYLLENQALKRADSVIVGDSLVHLFHPHLMVKELPGKKLVNRGIGGDTTELLLERLDTDVLLLNPRQVFIEIGGNDLIQEICLSKLEANVRAIISKIQTTSPRTQIIWINIPPVKRFNTNTIVPVYNQFLERIAKTTPNFTLIDLYSEMRMKDTPQIEEAYTIPMDDVHFNENGYAVLGKLLRPYLN